MFLLMEQKRNQLLREYNTTNNTNTKKITGKINIMTTCSICQELISNNNIKFCCNQYYHYGCISEWLKTKSVCPICRKNISRDIINQFSKIDLIITKISNTTNYLAPPPPPPMEDPGFYLPQVYHRLRRRRNAIGPSDRRTITNAAERRRPERRHFRSRELPPISEQLSNEWSGLLDLTPPSSPLPSPPSTPLSTPPSRYVVRRWFHQTRPSFIPQQPPTIVLPPISRPSTLERNVLNLIDNEFNNVLSQLEEGIYCRCPWNLDCTCGRRN